MDSNLERLNITLPREIVKQLDLLAGPRKRSSFIAEAIRKQLAEKQKETINALLEEGYRASAKESLSIAQEFESVDLKNWDEY
ncbi:conserved hypothetical protein [uncultured Desulfobacterium sp.]|uniref:Ribbon-helix-helix protein CopG domain-containing protein n=1 Tax=uncultured Desulfobacterium sp. TaxID=201089 RepID=A0A445N1R4_9BACT|nr:conserved hypothetical protein [uncultured Desulfobacterium sp.]